MNISDYGIKADGITDDTAALQNLLNEKVKTGGIVNLPAGKYLIAGSITVPVGVALVGEATAPISIDPLCGTIILATGSRDNEEGPALFEMGASTAVQGLTIYYPEQKSDDIHPYPWTFHLFDGDNTVENITLINSYNGIKVGPEVNVRHRIRSVYGCVLRRGIFVDYCVDIGRIDNVQFHCHWWTAAAVNGHWEHAFNYMIENCEAFIFGRTDWEYVNNTFVFPTKIGYRFIKTKNGAMNGQLCGIGSDASQLVMKIEEIQPMGLLITNGQFVSFTGSDPKSVVIEESCDGSVRFVNCSFWGHEAQRIISHGKGTLSLSDSAFFKFMNDHPEWVNIEADNGKLQVRGCSFNNAGTHIKLKEGLKHAIITQNNGEGGVVVENEIGNRAIIERNEPVG